jgi:acetyl-CoA carboxylase biotin carboxylase subunit
MLEKILIANRGEIAVRVLRCCRELGIPTVAVYSDADRQGLHVRYADEARRIGPPPASQSYLQIEALLEAARQTGARAVHPGYGFLAENPEFARRCREAGLIFVGPPPEAMALLGDKAAARRVARQAGVPIVPGSEILQDQAEAAREAEAMGYPLVIKAAAGGGGKGMRVVRRPADLASAFREAKSEAGSSFGDPSVYLERYLERPRHVEFQILADGAGNVLHLGERECSVQRRHQKLIEESPSSLLDDKLRREMGAAAVALARASSYVNAGTVEFLVDVSGKFYFLEVNARLQVEHPVTEMVTGWDLVRLQLLIAGGGQIPFHQEDVSLRGWAMEFRISAEDPFSDFLPSSGPIRFLRPAGGPGVRDDTGVYSGAAVSAFYDPLIAKLIVWGEDRKSCLRRAERALAEYQVDGVATTLPFFRWVVRDRHFQAGDIDTGYIDRHWKSFVEARSEASDGRRAQAALAAAAFAAYRARRAAESRPTTGSGGGGSAWKRAALRDQLGSRL